MNPDALILLRQVAERAPSEREAFYAQHGVSSEVRDQVEALLGAGERTLDSFAGHVASAAIRSLLEQQLTPQPTVPSRPPLQPGAIGRYQVIRLLGRGGMSEVYLARDPILEREIAVKLIAGELDDDGARRRLVREAGAAGRLRHPNIVTIFDAGEYEGQPYIAMEHVAGETLRGLIRRREPLPLGRRLALIEDACAGLGHAHRAGVVHLDVKPDNLILDETGTVKVLDFGIARVLTSDSLATRHAVGTLRYMSPEQVAGEPLDHRSDIFSLGSSLYELLTYVPAYAGSTKEVIYRIAGGPVPRLQEVMPGTDPRLDAAVARAMALEPADRFDDAEEFRAVLARLRAELDPAGDRPVDTPDPLAAFTQIGGEVATPPAHRHARLPPQDSSRGGLAPDTSKADAGDVGPKPQSLEPRLPPAPGAERRTGKPDATGERTAGGAGARAPRTRRAVAAGATVMVMTTAGAVWLWSSRPGVEPDRRDRVVADASAADPAPATVPEPSAEPSAVSPATPPPSPDSASDDANEVLRRLAAGDRAGVLRLLQAGGPQADPSSVDRLRSSVLALVNRTVGQTRASASAAPGAASTDAYRTAEERLGRANRLEAAGDSIGALGMLWQASDLYLRASSEGASVAPPEPPAAAEDVTRRKADAEPAVEARVPPTAPALPATVGPARSPAVTPPPSLPSSGPAVQSSPPAANTANRGTAGGAEPTSPDARPRTDVDGVLAALDRYRAAYQARDISRVTQVFPSLNARQVDQIRESFDDNAAYEIEIRGPRVDVNGDDATADALVVRRITASVGAEVSTSETPTRFRLRRTANGWVVADVAVR